MSVSVRTEPTLRTRREFFTWREAVLTADAASGEFGTRGRPRVRKQNGRWVVTYDFVPTVFNS